MKKERGQYFKSLGYRLITEEDFENYSLKFRVLDFDIFLKNKRTYPETSHYDKNLEFYIKITEKSEDCECCNLIFYDKGVFKIDLACYRVTAPYGTRISVNFFDDIERYYELKSLQEVKEIEHLL